MDTSADTLDQADEEILTDTASDEALGSCRGHGEGVLRFTEASAVFLWLTGSRPPRRRATEPSP
jgi:hypothetical protein